MDDLMLEMEKLRNNMEGAKVVKPGEEDICELIAKAQLAKMKREEKMDELKREELELKIMRMVRENRSAMRRRDLKDSVTDPTLWGTLIIVWTVGYYVNKLVKPDKDGEEPSDDKKESKEALQKLDQTNIERTHLKETLEQLKRDNKRMERLLERFQSYGEQAVPWNTPIALQKDIEQRRHFSQVRNASLTAVCRGVRPQTHSPLLLLRSAGTPLLRRGLRR